MASQSIFDSDQILNLMETFLGDISDDQFSSTVINISKYKKLTDLHH